MSSKPRSRRQFLRQVGIAAGLAAVPLARRGRAQTKRQVTMRLDWLYQGPNAGFLIAQDKGFYEQAGLSVEIGPGKGSGSTAQLVASILWYADCGVTAVSNGIIVHGDLIKDDPELIRSFVAASLKGFLYGRAHIDEIAAVVKKFSEATVPAISRREAELSFDTWVTPNTAGKPLGWMSDKDWNETVAVLKQYGGVTAPLEAAQLYTNEFVPTSGEFVPPQGGPSKT